MATLVTNLSSSVRHFLTATLNAGGAKPRRTVLNGREYLIAPLVSIVPGVLAGSKGPLLYPAEECARNARDWDGTPIVIYHPSDPLTNRPMSAGEDITLHVGFLKDSRFDGRLRHAAWFDTEKLRAMSADTLNRLERGQPVEVSTGLYTENDKAPFGAAYRGKPYDWVARQYKPDHLAVLPDQIGACSLKDGCGLMVNAATDVVGNAEDEGWRTLEGGQHVYVKGDAMSPHGPGEKSVSKDPTQEKKPTSAKPTAGKAPKTKTPKATDEMAGHPMKGMNHGEMIQHLSKHGSYNSAANPHQYGAESYPKGVNGPKLVEDVKAHVKDTQAKNSYVRPTLKDAYDAVKGSHPGLTIHGFHSALAVAHVNKQIRLDPFTQAKGSIEHPEHMMPLDRETKGYVDLPATRNRRVTANVWTEAAWQASAEARRATAKAGVASRGGTGSSQGAGISRKAELAAGDAARHAQGSSGDDARAARGFHERAAAAHERAFKAHSNAALDTRSPEVFREAHQKAADAHGDAMLAHSRAARQYTASRVSVGNESPVVSRVTKNTGDGGKGFDSDEQRQAFFGLKAVSDKGGSENAGEKELRSQLASHMKEINRIGDIGQKRRDEAKDQSIKGLLPTAHDWLEEHEKDAMHEHQLKASRLEYQIYGDPKDRVPLKRQLRRAGQKVSEDASLADLKKAVGKLGSKETHNYQTDVVGNWCNQYGGTTCKEGSAGARANAEKAAREAAAKGTAPRETAGVKAPVDKIAAVKAAIKETTAKLADLKKQLASLTSEQAASVKAKVKESVSKKTDSSPTKGDIAAKAAAGKIREIRDRLLKHAQDNVGRAEASLKRGGSYAGGKYKPIDTKSAIADIHTALSKSSPHKVAAELGMVQKFKSSQAASKAIERHVIDRAGATERVLA